MNRTGRRFLAAAICCIIIVIGGSILGIYSARDLINQVAVSEVENEYGGYTYSKVANEDKTVDWTDSYEKDFMPTIDNQKPYQFVEKTDAENYIVEFYFIYRTDRSVEEVIEFYTDYYGDLEIIDLDRYISLETTYEYYDFRINVEEDEGVTEVSMSAIYPEE
jgi:hypothetical protein